MEALQAKRYIILAMQTCLSCLVREKHKHSAVLLEGILHRSCSVPGRVPPTPSLGAVSSRGEPGGKTSCGAAAPVPISWPPPLQPPRRKQLCPACSAGPGKELEPEPCPQVVSAPGSVNGCRAVGRRGGFAVLGTELSSPRLVVEAKKANVVFGKDK